MTDPIDFHPLPGDGPDDATCRLVDYLAEYIEEQLTDLPANEFADGARLHEAKARLLAARAALNGHAVLFGWDIAYRDDIGACALVGDPVRAGDLHRGDRPMSAVIGNVSVVPSATV